MEGNSPFQLLFYLGYFIRYGRSTGWEGQAAEQFGNAVNHDNDVKPGLSDIYYYGISLISHSGEG